MCNKFIPSVVICGENQQFSIETCNSATENGRYSYVKNAENILPSGHTLALTVVNKSFCTFFAQWGFKSGSSLVINARCETAAEKPMFKSLTNHQRCVLPAKGYYEWRDADGQCHLITHKNAQSFYIAGLYRSDERGRLNFVVLTRKAYGLHAKIHSRMPCLLYSKSEAKSWLSGEVPLQSLCTSECDPLIIEAQGYDQLRMDFDD